MSKAIDIPVRKNVVYTMILSALAIGFIFIIIDPSVLMITVMSPVMAAIVVTAWWVEYHTRPTRVVVEGNGIRLHYRTGREAFVDWHGIQAVGIRQGDHDTPSGRFNSAAAVKTFEKTRGIPITVEAAQAIIDAYTAARGKPPPSY